MSLSHNIYEQHRLSITRYCVQALWETLGKLLGVCEWIERSGRFPLLHHRLTQDSEDTSSPGSVWITCATYRSMALACLRVLQTRSQARATTPTAWVPGGPVGSSDWGRRQAGLTVATHYDVAPPTLRKSGAHAAELAENRRPGGQGPKAAAATHRVGPPEDRVHRAETVNLRPDPVSLAPLFERPIGCR